MFLISHHSYLISRKPEKAGELGVTRGWVSKEAKAQVPPKESPGPNPSQGYFPCRKSPANFLDSFAEYKHRLCLPPGIRYYCHPLTCLCTKVV